MVTKRLHAWTFARIVVFALIGLVATEAMTAQGRPRARDLGIKPGLGSPGPLNAITDVAGVRVGHTTLIAGDTVRTGVTAIVPHGGNLFREKVPGAVFVGNAFGKLAGSTQVQELGTIESPIVLTNTLGVGVAVDAVVRWTLAQPGNENVRSVNALVGETNDGGLNDIRGLHVTRDHVTSAIASAREGAVDEGAIGAGTGTVAFGWKGGIGTASRRVGQQNDTWTVGVLVQSNYGGRLTIGGVPVWRELTPRTVVAANPEPRTLNPEPRTKNPEPRTDTDGSCMIVVATDAPLDALNLERLAARAIFALARTGSTFSNGSGDYAVAFSTHPSLRLTATDGPQPRTILPTDGVSALFEAVMDATEEAVYNSLLKATDTTGSGRTVQAIPIAALTALLEKYLAMKTVLAAAIALVLSVATGAQEGRFRTSVETVSIYATVSDADGRLVPDLVKEDFTVLDNGAPRDITLFSNETQPITAVVMLDMSGSMFSRFVRLRTSTISFVDALQPRDRAQIGTFGEEIAISPHLTGDKQLLKRVLNTELWPNGPTPIWNALDQAMTALSSESGRRVVMTITDGRELCNYRHCVKAGAVERRAVREGFMLYAIGMDGTGLDEEIMSIAEETGGGHFALPEGADLTSTFVRVTEELRRQYLIGFSPAVLDGKLHRVEVRVGRTGMKVRARRNYLAGRS